MSDPQKKLLSEMETPKPDTPQGQSKRVNRQVKKELFNMYRADSVKQSPLEKFRQSQTEQRDQTLKY